MKKEFLLTAFLAGCFFFLYGQAPPQAFNYSSVIRGNNGQALPNKEIALRLTILSGSPSGTVVYQETHLDTTDQWGVINLAIGMGTVQQGNFSTINWGGSTHYLQVELDETGGTNFTMMGTVQLLSVPYALYAGKATAIDSGGISGNTDWLFPDGNNGTPVWIMPFSSYTVPTGKSLFFTYGFSDSPSNTYLYTATDTFFINGSGVIAEGTTVNSSNGFFNGILVDKGVEILNWITRNPYTVPVGKTLYLLSARTEAAGALRLNGVSTPGGGGAFSSLLIFPGGSVLSWQNSFQGRNHIFTGYLK